MLLSATLCLDFLLKASPSILDRLFDWLNCARLFSVSRMLELAVVCLAISAIVFDLNWTCYLWFTRSSPIVKRRAMHAFLDVTTLTISSLIMASTLYTRSAPQLHTSAMA